MLLKTGIFEIPLLFREWLRLWDYHGDLIHSMNKYQLCGLWEDIRLTPPDKVMTSVLEAVMTSQTLSLNRSREDQNI